MDPIQRPASFPATPPAPVPIDSTDPFTRDPDAPPPEPDPGLAQRQMLTDLFARQQRGANWFYWVAGLSLVNSALILFQVGIFFLGGLGVTHIADWHAANGRLSIPVAIVFDLIVAAMVAGTGWIARKRFIAAFLFGMAAYSIDGLVLLLIPDWLNFGFHIFVLIGMFGGLKASWQINQMERGLLAPR